MLQNELPSKEKDLGSFVLQCIIGNTTVSNALTYLGASISVMSFSMFKCLGLGNPRPVSMVIEMVDRSMQSPKGIVKNVLVKIHKFIFLVDFVILDIIKDDKVRIILRRPMLATGYARIDVFGGKISLEVGIEQIIFNANEGATHVTVLLVCVINDYDDNDLLPNFDPEVVLLSPRKSLVTDLNPVGESPDSDSNLGSHSKEMEFEVKSTRIHVAKMLLFGRNLFGYAGIGVFSRSNISQGDCFIPFDIKQSFSRLVNLLEVKQHVSTSVKEIDNVQLGIVNQAELKLFPRVLL
ncbi:retrovirus-related pol polyprotein from transposon TNT 1-94 [Tanacetum coccineum]